MNPKKIMPIGLFANGKIVDSQGKLAEKFYERAGACRRRLSYKALFLLLFTLPLGGVIEKQGKPPSQLQKIKQAGEIKIATRYGPASYYEGPDGHAGLEYDLARLFAQRLGVRAKFVVAGAARQVTRMVESHQADFAAAGLMATEARKKIFKFTPAYHRISEQVVYRSDHARPRYVSDLAAGILEIGDGAGHSDTLQALRQHCPDLTWSLNYEQSAEGLLHLVNEGLLDYTIVQSDQMQRMQRFYPQLQVAFAVGKARDVAWAFARDIDPSLYDEAVRFFEEIKRNHKLEQLIDRYYGHSASYDPALDSSMRVDFRQRLPKYKALFMRAGEEYGIDWRLLAALAYQESHWNGKAVSAEGVRGMMMLTGVTARELKVSNRFDAAQSIRGGASYLHDAIAAMPPQIQSPDRVWMAMAAYNVGYGHIEDARRLAREQGGDPDKWIDVKKTLPLLDKKSWHAKTRHGHARGALAVHYVTSIRRYYDLLVWLTEEEQNRRIALGPVGKPAEEG